MAHCEAMPRTPRRAEVPVSIRVKPEVYEAIKAAATAGRRSINRQIELLIDLGLEQLEHERQGQSPPP